MGKQMNNTGDIPWCVCNRCSC